MNGMPLTSNAAETFNRHFYGRFEQCHPGLTTFFEKQKVNQSNVENNIECGMANLTNVPESIYKKKLDSMKKICEKYHSYYNMYYIKIIAKIYTWKLD